MPGSARIVRDNRTAVKARLHRAIDAAIEQAAQRASQDASENAPRRSGYLADHIFHNRVREGHWRVTATTPYAFFVEHGTTRMAAQPFLTPAYLRQKRMLAQTLGRLLSR